MTSHKETYQDAMNTIRQFPLSGKLYAAADGDWPCAAGTPVENLMQIYNIHTQIELFEKIAEQVHDLEERTRR